MCHNDWKMGTMVERTQPVGPPNLFNNMVKGGVTVRCAHGAAIAGGTGGFLLLLLIFFVFIYHSRAPQCCTM